MKLLLLAAACGLAVGYPNVNSRTACTRSLRNTCYTHGSLRLCGHSPTRGRIEIRHRNRWGSLCDDIYGRTWVINFGRVACRQMGFSGPNTNVGNTWYGNNYGVFFNAGSACPGSGPIWMDDLRCRGNEARINDCPHRGWGSHNCGHYEDVGVSCRGQVTPVPTPTPTSECPQHDVSGVACANRIAASPALCTDTTGYWFHHCRGSCNLHAGSACPTVEQSQFRCADQLGQARCARRMANYPNMCAVSSPMWWRARCRGTCDLQGNLPCQPQLNCDNGLKSDLQCQHKIHSDPSICTRRYYHGTAGINWWGMQCRGTCDRLRLRDCVPTPVPTPIPTPTPTYPALGVRVACTQALSSTCYTYGSLRLCGHSPSRGRLEIHHNNRWGSICDDIYSSSRVQMFGRVACRQMGFSGPNTAVGNSGYGSNYGVFFAVGGVCPGTGPIWMDDLNCNGSETTVPSCRHRGWGSHNCGHYEDVGVSCLGTGNLAPATNA